jgi:hypothetical protein
MAPGYGMLVVSVYNEMLAYAGLGA